MNFQLRSVGLEDLEDLYQLGQLFTFINLPADRDEILKLIKKSLRSFENHSPHMEENYYLFVLEDLKEGKVIGCSLIHAQHGTKKEPHFYLRLGQEHKLSQTLNTGFVHGTLRLGVETNGPTEIGALVLHPEYRAHPERLGKQLSFVRFLYMSLFPERFKAMIHVELMPPFDANGDSPLWEAIGRRFLNMDYQEADRLSRQNKEFILSLFPSENIYTTLLSPEVRSVIGEVGPDTLPVKRMLEEIGFSYTKEVDPFDGGPHYRCERKEIYPIKHSIQGVLKPCSDELIKKSATHPQFAPRAYLISEINPSNNQVMQSEFKAKKKMLILDESQPGILFDSEVRENKETHEKNKITDDKNKSENEKEKIYLAIPLQVNKFHKEVVHQHNEHHQGQDG